MLPAVLGYHISLIIQSACETHVGLSFYSCHRITRRWGCSVALLVSGSTVRCHYNTVICIQNHHNRHPIDPTVELCRRVFCEFDLCCTSVTSENMQYYRCSMCPIMCYIVPRYNGTRPHSTVGLGTPDVRHISIISRSVDRVLTQAVNYRCTRTDVRKHGGFRCPDTKYVPGHRQPPCWLTYVLQWQVKHLVKHAHHFVAIKQTVFTTYRDVVNPLVSLLLAITMTSQWAWWRLRSPASRLFTQPFIRAQIKENIKAPRHWPLYGEFIGDRWIPRKNGQ